MVIHTTKLKFSSKENETEYKKRDDREKHHLTLEQRQKKSLSIFWLWCCRHVKAAARDATYSTIEMQTNGTSRKSRWLSFWTFKHIVVQFQQKIVTTYFQNKEMSVEDDSKRMDNRDSLKSETTKFHSNEIFVPSKAWKMKQSS